MALSAPGLVLWLWWCSSARRFQKAARSSACRATSEYRGDIRGVRRGYLWGYSRSMLAKIGCGASGGGGGRLQAALAGGGTGAPGRPRGGASGGRVQQLVDAIIELGHLPTQSKNSSQAEKTLAVRLIRARQAGSLSSKQKAALGKLGSRRSIRRDFRRCPKQRLAFQRQRSLMPEGDFRGSCRQRRSALTRPRR